VLNLSFKILVKLKIKKIATSTF